MQLFLVLLHKITHFERIVKTIWRHFSACSDLFAIFRPFAHKIAEASVASALCRGIGESVFGIGSVFVVPGIGILHTPNNYQNKSERNKLNELPPSAVVGVVEATCSNSQQRDEEHEGTNATSNTTYEVGKQLEPPKF